MAMESRVEKVRPSEVEWEILGTHGLRRKLLGTDGTTGGTTAIVGIPRGWRGGGIAHYHHAFEEVYMLEGSVTLDGNYYWRSGDYFYRPAHVVHGHDEKSPEGALALVRSDGPLELLLVHDPEEPEEYPLPASRDGRGHVKHVVVAEVPPVADPAFPSDWKVRALSADPGTGARTLIVDVPRNWSGEAPSVDGAWEAMILAGSVDGELGRFELWDYARGQAGSELLGARSSEEGCSFLLWLSEVAG
jgi:quercetin dioxygenase-like cupin family protein